MQAAALSVSWTLVLSADSGEIAHRGGLVARLPQDGGARLWAGHIIHRMLQDQRPAPRPTRINAAHAEFGFLGLLNRGMRRSLWRGSWAATCWLLAAAARAMQQTPSLPCRCLPAHLFAMPIASAPPEPPSPMTMLKTGTRRPNISRKL